MSNLIHLHKKVLAEKEQVDTLYHEICHLDRPEMEDLELTILGALNNLMIAAELIEEMIEEECA
jgi:hypothetical protein